MVATITQHTDHNASVLSTADHLDCLLSIMDLQDSIVDYDFPRISDLGRKMISTQQQLSYQQKTRDNGCLPMGLA